ncbi:MAG: hypothetical protein H7255_16300 [Ramlibacter sp.]|nr:hypothetical protein [Ramlibacter sp.]
MNDLSRFESRKFIIAAVLVLAAIGMRLGGFLTEGAFVELAKWVAGLYFGFNVLQKITPPSKVLE